MSPERTIRAAPKIFGIGLSRTGTHSLAAALNAMGLFCCHNPSPRHVVEMDVETAISKFTACVDTSVSAYFRELDRMYPESAFVLTVRENVNGWIDSCVRHFESSIETEAKKTIRRRLYGHARPANDRTRLREANTRHRSRVRQYFSTRKCQFLEIDVTSRRCGIGERLRSFLVKWWRGVPDAIKQRCPLHARSTLNNLHYCRLPPRFPHIRTENDHRRASLCYVYLKDRLVLVAGHVQRLLLMSKSDRGADASPVWVNRYAVISGFRLDIYSSSKCVESRGSIVDIRACVVLPRARNRSIVLRRKDGAPVLSQRSAKSVEIRGSNAGETGLFLSGMLHGHWPKERD